MAASNYKLDGSSGRWRVIMDKLGGWMAGWLDAPLALADDAVVLQLPRLLHQAWLMAPLQLSIISYHPPAPDRIYSIFLVCHQILDTESFAAL